MPLVRFFLVAISALLALMAQSLHAHQQKHAVTSVLFNERSGNIEVVHRFYLHDAEHALKQHLEQPGDLAVDADAQKWFSQYIRERFSVRWEGGEKFALDYVGYEADGKFFWVYEETPIPKVLGTLEVRQDALREILSSQRNLVNVEFNGQVKSLSFGEQDTWKSVKINAD